MNIYCIHEDREIYHVRKQSILQQCAALTDNYQLIWITDFPVDFFTDSQNAQSPYVRYDFQQSIGAKSCFYKHYAAFKQIATSGQAGLVIEDDAIFSKNLLIKSQHLLNYFSDNEAFYINIEFTTDDIPLWYFFYDLVEMKGTKLAGAYLISPIAAKKCYEYIDEQLQEHKGIHLPADAFITEHYADIGIQTYWSKQALVFQGSKLGNFSSDLTNNKSSINNFYLNLFLKKYFLHFINKSRACFRKKIHKRVISPRKFIKKQ